MPQRKHLTKFRILCRPSGRRWDWRYAVCLACLPGIIGCASNHEGEEQEESSPSSPVPVSVAKALLITLRPSIDLVGTLEGMPERTAIIAPQIAGRIQSVSVVEGAIVNRGHALVQIDNRQSEAERMRAQAVVGQQQAALDRLKHGYLPQEIEIAKQDERQAKSELESLRLSLDATATLHENNEVSDVEFKKLQAMMQRDEAAYAAASAKLDLYQVGTRPEVIAEAQAQLDVAQAELVRAQLAVEFCTITSPIDGVVTQLLSRAGMNVAQSDQLATIVDLSQIFVRLRVPSGYLMSVKQDARVDVDIPSLGEQSFKGKIQRFSGQADPITGDVQAFAVLQNTAGLFRPGLACRVRVWLPPIQQALVVPVSAVADREGTSVLHVVRNNKAYEVEVSIGVETREHVQITEGLSADDTVITAGGYGLPEGCPVDIKSK